LGAEDAPVVGVIRVSFDLDNLPTFHIGEYTTVAIANLAGVPANCDPFLLLHSLETRPVTRDYQ